MRELVRIDFRTSREIKRDAKKMSNARACKKTLNYFQKEDTQLRKLRFLKTVDPEISMREIMKKLHVGQKKAAHLSELLSEEQLIPTSKQLKLDNLKDALMDYPDMNIRELSQYLHMSSKTIISYVSKYNLKYERKGLR